jgi:hypothetical protein
MNEVYAAAEELQAFFDERGWPNCVIGAIAVIRWGRQRTTTDADFTLLTGFGSEREFLEQIAQRYPGREPHEIEFALRARVYRCFAPNRTPIDIGLAAFPYEEQIIARARAYTFASGSVVRVCDLHDLIVMKAFAGRDQDWGDLQYLVAWHRTSIDWSRIDETLEELCNLSENFTSVPRLAELRRRIDEINRNN